MIFVQHFESPLGDLQATATAEGLLSLAFIDAQKSPKIKLEATNSNLHLDQTKQQLADYFSGTLRAFNVSLCPQGTDFQRTVWEKLVAVPYGKTRSYLDMAKTLGDENVIRAAAAANGKNPIAIIIPCHRIIGSNGSLVGYAGDLWRKKWLLQHEAKFGPKDAWALF